MEQPDFSVTPKFIYWGTGRVRLQWHCPDAKRIELYRSKSTSSIPDCDNVNAADCELLLEDDEHVGRGLTDDLPGTGYYSYTLVALNDDASVQASAVALKVSGWRLTVLMLLIAAFCGALLSAFLNFVVEPDLAQLTGMARLLTATSWAAGALGAAATFPLVAFLLGQVPDSVELPLGRILVSDQAYYATLGALSVVAAIALVAVVTSNNAVVVNDTEETVAAFANDELIYVIPPGMHRIRPSGEAYEALLTSEEAEAQMQVTREFSPDRIRLEVIETKSGDATRAVRMSCPDIVTLKLPKQANVKATLQLDDKKYEPQDAGQQAKREARFIIRNASCSASSLSRANRVVLELQATHPHTKPLAYSVTLKKDGLWTDAWPTSFTDLKAQLVSFAVPWLEQTKISARGGARAWSGRCREGHCYLLGLHQDGAATGEFWFTAKDGRRKLWELTFFTTLESLYTTPDLAADPSPSFREVSLIPPENYDYASLSGLTATLYSSKEGAESTFVMSSPFRRSDAFAYVYAPGRAPVEVEGHLEFLGTRSKPVRVQLSASPSPIEMEFEVSAGQLDFSIVDSGTGVPSQVSIWHPGNGIALKMRGNGHSVRARVPSIIAPHLGGANLTCFYPGRPSHCGKLAVVDERGGLEGDCIQRCIDVPKNVK